MVTTLPRLYPGHRHRWTDHDPDLFTRGLVRCTVCGFTVPRTLADLDGQPAGPDAHCRARWERLGDAHLHRCEFIGNHAPPHRCRDCGSETYRERRT